MTLRATFRFGARGDHNRGTWFGFPAARFAWDPNGTMRKKRPRTACGVDGFSIDRTLVSNRLFNVFVQATGT